MRLIAVFRRFAQMAAVGGFCTMTLTGTVLADGASVVVLDRDGKPVPDVAVFVDAPDSFATHAPAGTRAVMDQVDQRFVPHLLVVQSGTMVEFPNSDTVAHHVYSFSHPNHFKLPIYKGHAHPPVSFDENGIVVLGCNIHDHMLAYIVVVDTPTFAKTNQDGVALLERPLEKGAKVTIWSPRIRDGMEGLSVTVASDQLDSAVAFNLKKSLRAPHDDQPGALSWNEY